MTCHYYPSVTRWLCAYWLHLVSQSFVRKVIRFGKIGKANQKMGKGSTPVGSRTIAVSHGLQSNPETGGAESGTATNPST